MNMVNIGIYKVGHKYRTVLNCKKASAFTDLVCQFFVVDGDDAIRGAGYNEARTLIKHSKQGIMVKSISATKLGYENNGVV